MGEKAEWCHWPPFGQQDVLDQWRLRRPVTQGHVSDGSQRRINQDETDDQASPSRQYHRCAYLTVSLAIEKEIAGDKGIVTFDSHQGD